MPASSTSIAFSITLALQLLLRSGGCRAKCLASGPVRFPELMQTLKIGKRTRAKTLTVFLRVCVHDMYVCVSCVRVCMLCVVCACVCVVRVWWQVQLRALHVAV